MLNCSISMWELVTGGSTLLLLGETPLRASPAEYNLALHRTRCAYALAFDCAGGHAGDDLSRGDECEDYGWDGDEHADRHDLAPVDVVLGHE